MKNLKFIILLFCCFITFGFQESNIDKTEPKPEQIRELLARAESSIDMMEFDKAQEQLNKSLDYAKQIDHKPYVALTSGILARMFQVRHEYDKAITELERAISIQREAEDEAGLAYSYVLYSKILNSKGDYDRALKYLDLAKKYYESEGDLEQLGLVSLNKAVLYLNNEETKDRALSELKNAEIYLENSENTYELSRLHYFLARAFEHEGNYEKAENSALKSLELAKEGNYTGMTMYSYGLLSGIAEKRRDLAGSLNYLQKMNEVREYVFNINKEALLTEANDRKGVDALKSTLDELTVQNAEQEKTLKVNKLTTILSVALITILSLLTLSLYKNNNLRARANELLQKKNSELILAKENAEKASLAKAQFLTTITHELRTPLYAVTGLTHLLLEESPTESQKEHLNSLKFSGEYLLSLINNILDLNKLEANKVEIVKTDFDLEKRMSDVLIALKNSADERNTKIHFDFDQNIPKNLVGDPLKISQILINLLGNSIKFTEDGDIWISVKQVRRKEKMVSLFFEIKDNGEGIGKEKQKAIFENFTQGSTQINRKFGGTGLGLSIVKNLLSLLNSEIELESELGKGSKFTFELNFESHEADTKDTTVAPIKIDEKPISNEIMEDKHILVVEDNKINQMITRKILEKNKVICDVADNGSIAIEKVQNNHFDLILMDIHMPGISGIEATIEIRKFDSEIPIIALTAVTLDDNLDEFYLNGFNDIIPKPYKTEEFFHKINKYLAARETTV
ncbi:ATP-binding protein [Christiangramia forsetii]|uniref:histidine kinase n=2 Tax=Christiangramia forsetii TaxID=411153 RepID=A0M4W6_CHRFK|nr:ATP-binding protein [Christiangramia forsetii]GGG22469.1 histidine kinase [Christiangramia forsetii]CAL67661.1 two-component system sensor histidine kinase/response regulator hybrid [Christiangramia forsetii KT0803]